MPSDFRAISFEVYKLRIVFEGFCQLHNEEEGKQHMESARQKISDIASAAKTHANIYKAKVEEKAERAGARTEEEKEIARERRKAKEAEAKMDLHNDKGRHAEEKLMAKQSHHLFGRSQQHPVGTANPMAGATAPSYPLGGNPTPPGHNRHYQT